MLVHSGHDRHLIPDGERRRRDATQAGSLVYRPSVLVQAAYSLCINSGKRNPMRSTAGRVDRVWRRGATAARGSCASHSSAAGKRRRSRDRYPMPYGSGVLSIDPVSDAVCNLGAAVVACLARRASAQLRKSSGEGKPKRVLYVNVLCVRSAPSMIKTNRCPGNAEAISSQRLRACKSMAGECCRTASCGITAQVFLFSRVTQLRSKSRAREASPSGWIPRSENASRTTTSHRSISKSHGTKSSGWEKMMAQHSRNQARSDGEVDLRSALPNPVRDCDTDEVTSMLLTRSPQLQSDRRVIKGWDFHGEKVSRARVMFS